MVVRIVAGSPTGPGTDPISPPEKEDGVTLSPPLPTAAKVFQSPALRPERIVTVKRVGWDEVAPVIESHPKADGERVNH